MAFTNLVNNGASSLSTQAEKPVKPFTGVTAIGDTRLELRIYVNTQETGGGVMAAEGIQHYPGTNIDYYRGSAAEINDFLQRVEFIPSRGAPGKPTTTNFALFLIDVQKQDITGRIYYAVVDTAAPQSISGAKSDQTIHSDSSIHPFSGVTINDAVANATETLTIQLSDAGTGGVLSLSGAAGVGASLTDKGDGLYQLTTTHNSAAELTMALAQLTFTPSQTGAPHTQVKTTFTLSATSSASGDLAVTDATTAVTTIYETPPTITGAVAGLRANVASPINPFPAIVINDNPDAQLTVTITLTGGAGTLTLDPTAGGLALSGGGNGV